MIVRKYIQCIEIGNFVGWDGIWETTETIKSADKVKLYLEERKKEDVSFCMGSYDSPRLGRFCVTYDFYEESEE